MSFRKIIHRSRYFSLVKEYIKDKKKRGKGKRVYMIIVDGWFSSKELEEIRNVVDPKRNIGGHDAYSWKFGNLDTAQKKYNWLLMKWV